MPEKPGIKSILITIFSCCQNAEKGLREDEAPFTLSCWKIEKLPQDFCQLLSIGKTKEYRKNWARLAQKIETCPRPDREGRSPDLSEVSGNHAYY
jgi:hypothetical protein